MLIPSKLSRPVRLDHTVVRERLLAKLSGANNFRLALITSPAGYGKTTLVSQWAAGKNDLGWYSLDEGDNQQERFASYEHGKVLDSPQLDRVDRRRNAGVAGQHNDAAVRVDAQ